MQIKPNIYRGLLPVLFFLKTIMLFPQTANEKYDHVCYSVAEALLKKDSAEALVLNRQRLKEFPSEILTLKRLRCLDLSGNRIRIVPDSIRVLEQLEILNLSNNRISELPAGLCRLKQLTRLDISRNQIYMLPKELGNLKNLRELIMWSTFVYILPGSVSRLKDQLETLDMRQVLMTRSEQEQIREMLPETNLLFSEPCNCR